MVRLAWISRGGGRVTTSLLTKEKGGRRTRVTAADVTVEAEAAAMPGLAFEVEERASRAGTLAASRSWKRGKETVSPRASRRNTALLTLTLDQILDF